MRFINWKIEIGIRNELSAKNREEMKEVCRWEVKRMCWYMLMYMLNNGC